jgi:hypothetical protein
MNSSRIFRNFSSSGAFFLARKKVQSFGGKKETNFTGKIRRNKNTKEEEVSFSEASAK